MNSTIRFPYLGLELNPGKSFQLFGINVAYYGVIIAIAMIVGVILAVREAKRTGQNVDDYLDFAIWTLIMAIVGARLYYCIFEWDYYSKYPLEIITGIRDGGLAIYGGVIASVITLIIFTKVKKLNFFTMADTCVPCLVIGQAIGRWGNFFNREAFGGYCNNIFAMQLPKDVALAHATDTQSILENVVKVDGVSFVQVHPTFLYESLWCILIFVILMLYRKHKKFEGEVMAMYFAGYGLGRLWIEALRTDQLKILGLPVSLLLSALLVIAAVVFIVVKRRAAKNPATVAAKEIQSANAQEIATAENAEE